MTASFNGAVALAKYLGFKRSDAIHGDYCKFGNVTVSKNGYHIEFFVDESGENPPLKWWRHDPHFCWDELINKPALAPSERDTRISWSVKEVTTNLVSPRTSTQVTPEPSFDDTVGYHVSHIEKGVFGESSKIREELEEFLDAEKQGCDLMCLIELSDLYGAMAGYLAKHHPTMTMKSLEDMSKITKRVFENGIRE